MLLKVPDSLVHLSRINSHNFSRVIFFSFKFDNRCDRKVRCDNKVTINVTEDESLNLKIDDK